MKRTVWRDFLNLPAVVKLVALALLALLALLFGGFVLPATISGAARGWLLLIAASGLLATLAVWGLTALVRTRGLARLTDALRTQGLPRGEAFEQTEVLREKFARKLGDLKANGLSVYRLPWFVLMGEPGCGKTYTLIHSGLSFPLGKDEVPGFGGTRNYNWWFTDEAVILDTAGRIAFHEEGTTDKAEWEFFLKLLRRNRPRCPINGVVVAVPADKLLRDNSDQRTQKAITLRDRLRQIQQQLGVRFPAFLVVTKMDLVGGFNEFCEEIRVDLAARNQMFGWSRAGAFQEPYDTGDFPRDFAAVTERVRDWSLRYLQRNVGDEERCLIATFPEAFRSLAEPLGDYVGTIFKKSLLAEPPFFRGFYFTSSVQEGVPILDVLRRSRGGAGLPERPPKPVDSKAFFIHDTYARKVFPEAGLVFRSATDVLRNRWARRAVAGAAGLMVVVLAGLFALGSYSVRGLVTGPLEDCRLARQRIEQPEAEPRLTDNLALARRLEAHARAYDSTNAALAARMVSVVADIAQPREHVRQIHCRFVLSCLLRPLVTGIERELAADDARTALRRAERMNAFAVYAKWCGEALGSQVNTTLPQRISELEALLSAADIDDATRSGLSSQFQLVLAALADRPVRFGRDVLGRTIGLDGRQGVQLVARLGNVAADAWRERITLSAEHENTAVAYWVGLALRVEALRKRHLRLLELLPELADSAKADAARQTIGVLTADAAALGDPRLSAPAGSIAQAYRDLATFLERHAPPVLGNRITRPLPVEGQPDLPSILRDFEGRWAADLDPLETALRRAVESGDASVSQALDSVRAARAALSAELARRLTDLAARISGAPVGDPLESLRSGGLIVVQEGRAGAPATMSAAVDAAEEVRTLLAELHELSLTTEPTARELPPLARWPELLASVPADESPRGAEATGSAAAFWQPERLRQIAHTLRKRQAGDRRADLLQQMVAAVERCLPARAADASALRFSRPGLPRLIDGRWQEAGGSPFAALSRYHTRALLVDALTTSERVRAACAAIDGAGPLRSALDRAAETYVEEYFADWAAVYREPARLHDPAVLTLVQECSQGRLAWADFVDRLAALDVESALAARVRAIRENVAEAAATLARDEQEQALVAARLEGPLARIRQDAALRAVIDADRPERLGAWTEYCARLKGLAAGGAARAGFPDAERLASDLGVESPGDAPAPGDPLVAFARYAPELARHELRSRIARIVGAWAGRFPVTDAAAVRQTPAPPVIEPRQFAAMLSAVSEARRQLGDPRFGESDACGRALERCAAWAKFLYGDEGTLLAGKEPPLMSGRLWITFSEQLDLPSRYYATLSLRLPVLDSDGRSPLRPIEMRADAILKVPASDFSPSRSAPLRFTWQLRERPDLPSAVLELSGKHLPDKLDRPQALALPSSAWTLPLLLERGEALPCGARALPVTLDVGGGAKVGVTLILQLGDNDAGYPGLIPPPGEAGPPPRLDGAGLLKQPTSG